MIRLLLLFILFAPALCAQSYNDSLKLFREEYINGFLQDDHSPLKKNDIQYLEFFPADEDYRIRGIFHPSADTGAFNILTYSGQTKKYSRYGYVEFNLKGKPFRLHIYQSISLKNNPQYKDYLFLPFKDETCGVETYGGGRYIDLRMNDIHSDKIVIDFNKSYNPYCAYSEGYSCPIPPDENHLPVAIRAGEKKYRKDSH